MNDVKYNLEDFQRTCERINEMAEKCRAWQAFCAMRKFRKLFVMGMRVFGFNYNNNDQFECQFGSVNDQRILRAAIQSIMREGFEVGGDPTLFKRRDIYDKMACASFPLNQFVETSADCKVTFSLPLPMVFAVSQFRMDRTRKKWKDGWWGRLYLIDGRVPDGWKKREVAEIFSPEEATRSQMFDALIQQVREKQDASMFTITGDSMLGALIKAQSDEGLKLQGQEKLELK